MTPSCWYVHLGETGASCYGGRLLQGHFMQNYYNFIDTHIELFTCLQKSVSDIT